MFSVTELLSVTTKSHTAHAISCKGLLITNQTCFWYVTKAFENVIGLCLRLTTDISRKTTDPSKWKMPFFMFIIFILKKKKKNFSNVYMKMPLLFLPSKCMFLLMQLKIRAIYHTISPQNYININIYFFDFMHFAVTNSSHSAVYTVHIFKSIRPVTVFIFQQIT